MTAPIDYAQLIGLGAALALVLALILGLLIRIVETRPARRVGHFGSRIDG